MEIYKHYKNKYYKYKGLVRHSEDLDELALYDCLYENDLGKTWVRPKDLFFGQTEVDGKTVERFKKIEVQVEQEIKVENFDLDLISQIAEASLGSWDLNWFQSNLKNHTNYLLLLAKVEDQVAGFKLGYEEDSKTFYSWLGGVNPKFRGLGIASELMKQQHEWCKQAHYSKLKTTTRSHRNEMLILNLKFGFKVVGTYNTQKNYHKILLEKDL